MCIYKYANCPVLGHMTGILGHMVNLCLTFLPSAGGFRLSLKGCSIRLSQWVLCVLMITVHHVYMSIHLFTCTSIPIHHSPAGSNH